jgi:hypothetical protein
LSTDASSVESRPVGRRHASRAVEVLNADGRRSHHDLTSYSLTRPSIYRGPINHRTSSVEPLIPFNLWWIPYLLIKKNERLLTEPVIK